MFTKLRETMKNDRARRSIIAITLLLMAVVISVGTACSRMELDPDAFSQFSSTADPTTGGGPSGGGPSGGIPVVPSLPDLQINDQFFPMQWTFLNSGQFGGMAGQDANIVPVWRSGNTGSGVLVAIVDDGAEIAHPDLQASIQPGASYNYNTQSTDPTNTNALHGTCVAGIIAGEARNNIGVAGVAPGARLAVYNFLESGNTNLNEVDAMTRNSANVAISNNSWGPGPGGYGYFRDSSAAWRSAIESGLMNGRGGKGTVYVFAAGNGAVSPLGEFGDQANLSGYANFYGVVPICSVDEKGEVAVYSEPGANLWVCAPSGSGIRGRPAVTTTDMSGGALGYNLADSPNELGDKAYTQQFSGTSAAAPLISGVVALILKERPDLTWRDVKWILARSARKNHPTDTLWRTNGATPPFNIHYDFGFGTVDAEAAVALARAWTLVKPMQSIARNQEAGSLMIDDAGTPSMSSLTITGSNIGRVEFVEVTADISHADWGNLTIDLKRGGSITTVSRLLINHKCLNSDKVEVNCVVPGARWRFGSSRHLGEPADGVWTLEVRDGDAAAGRTDGVAGTFRSWQIRIFGESQ